MSRKTGSPARMLWYMSYRLLRINKRELAKVWTDKCLWGTGAYKMGEHGTIEHIPWRNMMAA